MEFSFIHKSNDIDSFKNGYQSTYFNDNLSFFKNYSTIV